MEPSSRRTRLCGTAAAFFVLVTLAGCGGGDISSGQPSTLRQRMTKQGREVRSVRAADHSGRGYSGLGGDSTDAEKRNSANRRPRSVANREVLPCTKASEPANFESFSAGRNVADLAVTATMRRCDSAGPAAERANYVSYIYGECQIATGATGCQPPLEIQTWPACQRFLAKYSYMGAPLPMRNLPDRGAAKVVEFGVAGENRIEVYTGESTIVVFATSRDLALAAVDSLRPLPQSLPPDKKAADVSEAQPDQLAPPAPEAMEGSLQCSS